MCRAVERTQQQLKAMIGTQEVHRLAKKIKATTRINRNTHANTAKVNMESDNAQHTAINVQTV